jgi:hypothetical protein
MAFSSVRTMCLKQLRGCRFYGQCHPNKQWMRVRFELTFKPDEKDVKGVYGAR